MEEPSGLLDASGVDRSLNPSEFVAKWSAVTASERAVAQSHFNDLCALLEVVNPVSGDPSGATYAFERHVQKAAGGKGFADVWKRGAFAWEYKAKGKDLTAAYVQLLLYRDDLENPPLLVVSDVNTIVVHTNFTGTTKAEHRFELADLLDSSKRAVLRQVWTNPGAFNPRDHRERVTKEAAEAIGAIALRLRDRGHDPERVAHFMMQVVFALFAEDVGLLPKNLVTRILERSSNAERVTAYLTDLFTAMSTGGEVLLEDIDWFNGGLFDGSAALPLEQAEVSLLHEAAQMQWADVEPAIFGTLFERSLDPAKRSQLGAHYTSRDDILRIVEPVVMQPLRARWAQIRDVAEDFLKEEEAGTKVTEKKRVAAVHAPISELLSDLHQLRVLDPACGSGNFLYVALQELKDFENEVVSFAEQIGSPGLRMLGPNQFHGIEISPFARELASMVVWIGYLQWNLANGITSRESPILKPLKTIQLHDALMNEDGSEFEWPDADFIIGNPPFLGGKRLRTELGDEYVDRLFDAFDGQVARESDLVTYWFEKARKQVVSGATKRVGLIATNSIRGGANRKVLEGIRESGDIFFAWSDEPWVLDGAAVRVSIVGFDDGTESSRHLDGQPVVTINANLTDLADITRAQRLPENLGRSFMGTTKGGAFDIPGELARSWLDLPNASGRSNRDVIKPWVNGLDLTRRPRDMWIIDFTAMTEEEASGYSVPWNHVLEHVRPVRINSARRSYREKWWQFMETRPKMLAALNGQKRYICTPTVAKYRTFAWESIETNPDHQLIVFATEADFDFGVLHSRIHEVWALAQGTSLEDRPRYTPSTCFETFPFPAASSGQREAIGIAARHLYEVREYLLAQDEDATITKLYNEVEVLREKRDSTARSMPLLIAHEALDRAVAEAYGFEWPLSYGEILSQVLELNLRKVSIAELGGAV